LPIALGTSRVMTPPTYLEFISLISKDRPDDKAWAFFWQDNHDGLAFGAFPSLWAEASSRRPGGTIREVIDAWPIDEFKALWHAHIYAHIDRSR
jgi:hypothetical protein